MIRAMTTAIANGQYRLFFNSSAPLDDDESECTFGESGDGVGGRRERLGVPVAGPAGEQGGGVERRQNDLGEKLTGVGWHTAQE